MNDMVYGHTLEILFLVFVGVCFVCCFIKVFFFLLPDKVTTLFRSTSVVLGESRWIRVKLVVRRVGSLSLSLSVSLSSSL